MWPSAPIAPLCCLKCANPFTLFSPSTKGPPRALCSWLNPYLALTPIGPPALSCLHPDPDPFPIFPPLPSIFTWCPRCPLSVLICVCACGCPIILRSSGSFNLFHFLPLLALDARKEECVRSVANSQTKIRHLYFLSEGNCDIMV